MAGDMVLGIQNEQALAERRCYDSGRKVVISRRGHSKIFNACLGFCDMYSATI